MKIKVMINHILAIKLKLELKNLDFYPNWEITIYNFLKYYLFIFNRYSLSVVLINIIIYQYHIIYIHKVLYK